MTIEAGRVVIQSLSKNKQWSQWLAVFSASITLFTTGICFTWTSPTLVILQSPDTPFNITNSDASWIASLMPFGSALGPILGSLLARQLGPKQTILISSAPFLLGFVLIILANGPGLLCASRFISGIGVGFGFSAVPIFIGEVAENHNRGALMILFTAMLGLGSLFMACVGPFITIQFMASIALVFPLLTLALLSFIPDSPFFLMRIEKEKRAISSLMWFRRQNDYKSIESELDSIKETVKNNQMSFFDCFKNITVKPNPKALLIILLAVLGQQFSGVLAVAFYQEQIYRDSRIPISPVLAVILSLVISNLAGLSSIFLVDRWGRKPLLLFSSLGCGISTALLGTYFQLSYLQDSHPNFRWLPIVAMNMLQISFSMGLGPVPYTILGEIFSSNFKEVAICLISVSGALAGTLVAKLFQVINDSFGSSVIFFSVSICTFSLLLVNWFVLPETMNKSLLEIQNMLTGNSKKKSDVPAEEKENEISTKTRF